MDLRDASASKKNDLWREEALTQSINCFNLSKRFCWAEWKRWKRKVFGLSEKAKGCVGLSEKEKFFLPEWKIKMLSWAEWKIKGCVKLSEKGKGCIELSGKRQYCIVIFILIWMRYECQLSILQVASTHSLPGSPCWQYCACSSAPWPTHISCISCLAANQRGEIPQL